MPSIVTAVDYKAKIRTKLTTTGATVVYGPVAGKSAHAVYVRFVNTSGGAANVTLEVVTPAAVRYVWYPTTALAGGAMLELDMWMHPLTTGEKLEATASVANTVQVLGTVVEM
jgi:hypothetical protein